ncbi:hypothetical protein B0O80DRAFT_468711 [Mortierella sp. GBAus27b]|nr:hypothetical protein B0O80DRAFT_468711 [Mortierella sp. GBAus27b]
MVSGSTVSKMVLKAAAAAVLVAGATVAGACAEVVVVVVVVVVVEAAMAGLGDSPTVAAGAAPAVVVSGNPVAPVTLVRATLVSAILVPATVATAVPLILGSLPTLGVLVRGGGSARGLRRGG